MSAAEAALETSAAWETRGARVLWLAGTARKPATARMTVAREAFAAQPLEQRAVQGLVLPLVAFADEDSDQGLLSVEHSHVASLRRE